MPETEGGRLKTAFRPSENLPQCQNLAKQREFQEAYGTTRPYGFTAGQLAAFGKGQSSPMAELAAGGNGIYLKPEYINASINSRIPEPVRQKAGELANQAGDAWRYNKAVLDNTAGKIRNQLGSQLDGSWDNRKTFGANAADKLAGSAGIMKTGLDGLGETTAGKAVGKKELTVMSADIFRPVYLVELATVIICFRRMLSLIIRNIRNILKMLFVRHIEKGKT